MTYQEKDQAKLMRQQTKQAILLAMQGYWKEAVEANKAIIESAPDDVDAYNRLGRAYMELGENSPAREAYTRTLELDPYNAIAKKNLKRLEHLREEIAAGGSSRRVDPQHFIEEVGKSGVVDLCCLAPPEVLARMSAGERVYLKLDKSRLVAYNRAGDALGQVEPRHGLRLLKLIQGGNKYCAAITSVSDESMKVLIKEIFQDPARAGKVSFPPRVLQGVRAYTGDRLLKRRLEYGEETDEEPDDTLMDKEELLSEGLSEEGDALDNVGQGGGRQWR